MLCGGMIFHKYNWKAYTRWQIVGTHVTKGGTMSRKVDADDMRIEARKHTRSDSSDADTIEDCYSFIYVCSNTTTTIRKHRDENMS